MTNVQAAEAVVPCAELSTTLAFFTQRLGFRVDTIFPADDPAVAVVSGHGLRLRLERARGGAPGALRLTCRDPAALGGGARVLTAPNGTRIELVAARGAGGEAPEPALPPLRPSFGVTRAAGAAWVEGRAGMLYRELLPARLGGGISASHIRIAEGGPVRDYVHFHEVAFQVIYCQRGWVRVAYEDQGEPFVLEEGDAVLQPPRIRHRVLACSPGLEVVELSAPAGHETHADHELALPTPVLRAEREFAGQRFLRHVRAAASWRPWRLAGFEARDLGIGAASGGLAEVHVARPAGEPRGESRAQGAELAFVLVFGFVSRGSAVLACEGRPAEALAEGDAFVLPGGLRHALTRGSRDLELLEIAFPLRSDPR
jgi:quercetin dioxygenase-like cupin family protein